MINVYGYNEAYWGSLAQYQTLSAPQNFARYSGYEPISWHPYEGLRRLPLDVRFASFCDRLAAVTAKRMRSA